jgi:drug/metabolite transporter (DMT)-like permease
MQLSPEFLLGVGIGILGAALYGISVVVYKSQSQKITALSVSALKMWIALPLMALLIVLSFGASPFSLTSDTILLLSISIILGAVIGDTIYLISQERIGVSYAFPIAMSFPILTYFFTIFFLNETPSIVRFLGVILAVIGVILISREQQREPDAAGKIDKADFLGIFLAIMTSLLYAAGTTILQVGVEDIDPVTGNFVRVLVGSFAFVPMISIAVHQGMPVPAKRTMKIVGIAGFFGMGIGSLLYVSAVKYAGAAVMSVISSTAPLFAVPISVFYLKERLTRIAGLGIVLTLSGIILVVLGF